MVLLMIRVQDTMVFRSPARQIKNTSEQNQVHSSTKTQKLGAPSSLHHLCKKSYSTLLPDLYTGMFWVGFFSEKLQIFPQ